MVDLQYKFSFFFFFLFLFLFSVRLLIFFVCGSFFIFYFKFSVVAQNFFHREYKICCANLSWLSS